MSAFHKAIGSLESRVLPTARKFRDLGMAGSDEIAVLEPVDTAPRSVTALELVDSGPSDRASGLPSPAMAA